MLVHDHQSRQESVWSRSDKKDSSLDEAGDNMEQRRCRASLRQFALFIITLYVTVIYVIPKAMQIWDGQLSIESQVNRISSNAKQAQSQTSLASDLRLIALEAHVMSKCPDARDCLRDLIVPAMTQIADLVSFNLSYIGTVGADDTIQCKHGSTECLGNMLGLCAAEMYPHDIKRSLGFSMCLIGSYKEIPQRSLIEHCALEHGISFDSLNACASEEGHGLDLLEASVERSKKAGVVKSCTVRVDEQIWCIRDGGEWKDCANGHEVQDLVTAIRQRHHGSQ